jgi:hypothetical protein
MVFSCSKCNDSFKTNRDLNNHLSRKFPCLSAEEKAKKNDCIGCDKTFSNQSNLKTHMGKCDDYKSYLEAKRQEEIRLLREEVNNLREEVERHNENNNQEEVRLLLIENNNQDEVRLLRIENNNQDELIGIDISNLSYGFVYVRDNSNYRRDNVYKIGITKDLNKRNKSYITGEYGNSVYVYLVRVKLNVLSYVDNELKKILQTYNTSNGGGTEFYTRDVLNVMDDVIRSLNIEHTIIKV